MKYVICVDTEKKEELTFNRKYLLIDNSFSRKHPEYYLVLNDLNNQELYFKWRFKEYDRLDKLLRLLDEE